MAKRKRSPDNPQVVVYLRVSTEQQAESGGEIGAQRAAIEAEVARRGWQQVEYFVDPASTCRFKAGNLHTLPKIEN